MADEMERLIAVGERIAVGLEKLAEDPQVEIEAGPPLCPHCGAHDPVVAIASEAGRGPLSHVFIPCECLNCARSFFVVIESYSCHADLESAKSELREREKAGFFDAQRQ